MKISDLARIAHVSSRTLRYYDEIGLFCPCRTDPSSGYRDYSVEQIPVLSRILALRDLGFTLEQMLELTRQSFTSERLVELLEQQKMELERRVQQEQQRLERLEAHLKALNRERNMTENPTPEHTVSIKPLPAYLIASVRNPALEQSLPTGGRSIERHYALLHEFLEQHHASLTTPQLNLWHDIEAAEWPEAEVAQVLEQPLPSSGEVRVYELPALERAACLLYQGRYDNEAMTRAFTALHGWVERQGYQSLATTRQVFLRNLSSGEYEIELQLPIRKS